VFADLTSRASSDLNQPQGPLASASGRRGRRPVVFHQPGSGRSSRGKGRGDFERRDYLMEKGHRREARGDAWKGTAKATSSIARTARNSPGDATARQGVTIAEVALVEPGRIDPEPSTLRGICEAHRPLSDTRRHRAEHRAQARELRKERKHALVKRRAWRGAPAARLKDGFT